MVSRFAEDPLNPCGTRVPGWPVPRPHGEGPPPPGEEPIISLSVLGALIFVGEGAGRAMVREAAVAAGGEIIERGGAFQASTA